MNRGASLRPRRWNQKRHRSAPRSDFCASDSSTESESRGRSSEVSVEVTDGSEQISLAGARSSQGRARPKAKMAYAASRADREEWDIAEPIEERRRRAVVLETAKSETELGSEYMSTWLRSERIDNEEELSTDWQLVVKRSREQQGKRLKDEAAEALNKAMEDVVWVHVSGRGKVHRCKLWTMGARGLEVQHGREEQDGTAEQSD